DTDELQARIAAVAYRADEKGSNPRGAAAVDGESAVAHIAAQFAALQQLDQLPENLYLWARIAHRTNLETYLRYSRVVAIQPKLDDLFTTPTDEELAKKACRHVLLNLGLRLTNPQFQLADSHRKKPNHNT